MCQRSFTAARAGLIVFVLGLFCAAMWYVWLGWDHAYYEVDGVAHGPYRAWQVIGCAACILAATVIAYLRTPAPVMILGTPAAAVLGFAVPWSLDAASTDETGMWVIGLFMILVGGGIGLITATALTAGVARLRRGHHDG